MMINHFRLPFAVLLTLFALGCDQEPKATNEAAATSSNPVAPAPATTPQYKPTYSLTINDKTITWTAEVNTGGWKMTTDQVLVEDSMGKTAARIYVTLEQPGADESATQAMETLEGKHVADRKIDTAELSVRQHVRDQQTTGASLYSVVKNARP